MNWLAIVAGAVAAFAAIGHFTIGRKEFLKPLLDSSLDEVPKKTMHCVFHYVSAFQVFSAIALLHAGTSCCAIGDPRLLVHFIAANYAAFAVAQLVIALTSGIPNAAFKMFQWIFWVIIAVTACLSAGH
jgi:hypothetical protein